MGDGEGMPEVENKKLLLFNLCGAFYAFLPQKMVKMRKKL